MILSTRGENPTPEESYVYNILHNFDAKQLYSFIYDGVMTTVGAWIGIFLCGGTAMLGLSSIVILFSNGIEVSSRRRYFLCTYIAVLLLLLITVEVLAFIDGNYNFISFFWSFGKIEENAPRFEKVSLLMVVLVLILTDGLLVWRCFLVQRVLARGSSKWYDMFWIFPACLYAITTVTGILTTTNEVSSARFGVIALVSDIALNIHTTLFIIIRLLLHRRMVMACAQNKKVAAQHIYIIGILLESAAINLPIAIATAIGLGTTDILVNIMLPIFLASQALAAVLIIHQTALGRVFSRQKETKISKSVEMRERSVTWGDNPATPVEA